MLAAAALQRRLRRRRCCRRMQHRSERRTRRSRGRRRHRRGCGAGVRARRDGSLHGCVPEGGEKARQPVEASRGRELKREKRVFEEPKSFSEGKEKDSFAFLSLFRRTSIRLNETESEKTPRVFFVTLSLSLALSPRFRPEAMHIILLVPSARQGQEKNKRALFATSIEKTKSKWPARR